MKDYYKILEIHPDASLEVMNNAYRALVRKYHPDLYHTTGKNPMEARMQEINEAYNVLSNESSRKDYDRRYGEWVCTHRQSGPLPARSGRDVIVNMLLWGIGTFIVLRFLLTPLLGNSFLKIALLFVVAYLFIRFYARSRRP